MKCPTCKGQLATIVKNNIPLNACNSCGGVWLEAGNLDALAGVSMEADLYRRATTPSQCRYCQSPLGFGSTCTSCGREATIDCVHGHGVMNAEIVQLPSADFEIDVCPKCRCTWIDGQEVGGMERASVNARRDQFLADRGARPYDIIEFISVHGPDPPENMQLFRDGADPLQFQSTQFSQTRTTGHLTNPWSLLVFGILLALIVASAFGK